METIIIKEAERIVQTVHLEKDEYMIGSDPDCDIVLDNILVAPRHAKLSKEDGEWIFRDLNSDDGSFLDNTKVMEHNLENGDEIQIGNFVLIYDSGFISEEETETKVVYEQSVKNKTSSSFSIPKLIGKNRLGKTIEYIINKQRMIIGRSLQADITIEDITISRMHAEILIKNGKFYIKDLDARNGTFINKDRVSISEITTGDIITFGTYSVKFIL